MIHDTRPYKLFSNCIVVDGATRSSICDLQRGDIHLIPLSLSKLINDFEGMTVADIIEMHPEDAEVIEEYFDFLYNNELIFFTSSPNNFPKLSNEWKYPFEISNAIIDFDQKKHDSNAIISQLESLNCKTVQLRFFSQDDWSESIMEFLRICIEKNSFIQNINIVIPYLASFSLKKLNEIIVNNPRINTILIYGAPKDDQLQPFLDNGRGLVIYMKDQIDGHKSCGLIRKQSFAPNIIFYTESIQHNTCLNRKISIDVDGEIKNCPSMTESFGNIAATTLAEALNHTDFKKKWSISKDQIKGCKDCEFRHVCMDCRAYLEDVNDDYSKPLKCGYDPYTGVWSEWSKNPLKQKAISEYQLT